MPLWKATQLSNSEDDLFSAIITDETEKQLIAQVTSFQIAENIVFKHNEVIPDDHPSAVTANRPYGLGRVFRAPEARLSQEELESLEATLKRDGMKYAEWLRGKITEDKMADKSWKLDIYQVIDGTDNWPLIDTVYGKTPKECEEKAEDKYGPNADDKHWTTAYQN